LNKLISYFEKKSGKLSILELGCGNGWLSHRLSTSLNAEILGIDVNEKELLQGAAIFKSHKKVSFMYADIYSVDLKNETFDVILLASSIQYFADLRKLVERLLELLRPDGEIHLVDSPIYNSSNDSQQAQKRSRDYFDSKGVPEMVNDYFHHSFAELKSFNHQILFNPNSLISLFKRKILKIPQSTFSWIMINHH